METEACSDPIHIRVRNPPYISINCFMEFMKGGNTSKIFERHTNMERESLGAESIIWMQKEKIKRKSRSISEISWKKIMTQSK